MLLAAAIFINKARWVVPAVCMVAPSPIIFTLIQALQIAKPIIGRKTYQYIDETIWSLFQRTVLCFFSNMNNTQIVYSGDYKELLESKENALFISNHQTSVDWICVDMLTVRQRLMGRLRYMLKDELKYIPFFGLYFYQHGCIHIGRYGKFDENKTVQQLAYLKEQDIPMWLVIFPEGTRFNPNNHKTLMKSRQFAEQNGLPVLEHTLVPRSRGVYLALRELRTHLDVVYDVTFGYESTRCHSDDSGDYVRSAAPGMVEFVLSYSPKLHINIRRIPIRDVPSGDQQTVTRWLHTCYERKDKMMEKFMKTGQLEEGELFYQPVNSWLQTLPYNCIVLSLAALMWSSSTGRRVYSAMVFGGLLGMIWMKFH